MDSAVSTSGAANLEQAKTAPSRAVYQLDPLRDARWNEFIERHPGSSVFHTPAWMEALRRTYGFEPVVFTTSPFEAALENGIALCRVRSWITGRRLVSLPFSDHCEPLVNSARDARKLTYALEETAWAERMRYVEVRGKEWVDGSRAGPKLGSFLNQPENLSGAPVRSFRSELGSFLKKPYSSYCFHELDLQPALDRLFASFHKSSIQRKILRAEREGMVYECGHSRELFDDFWRLFIQMRRRHGAPPQPKAWFHNLMDCFGPALQIRVAYQDKRPTASILTIRHKDTLVYKYGCSDTALNQMGGTQLVFWRAIQEARQEGMRTFDLGRTDWDNTGLITFKDRWGADRSTLVYTRISVSPASGRGALNWAERAARQKVCCLPDRLMCLAGGALYKHFA